MLELFDGILDTYFLGLQTFYLFEHYDCSVYALLCHNRSCEKMY